MTRSRAWYVQLAFGFLAMLASMGLVDRYITPAIAAPSIDSTSDASKDMKVVTLKSPSTSRAAITAPAPKATRQVEQKEPEYWIGVRCYAPLPPVLRAHIDIPEGQGLQVLYVVEKGPGQKAGLKQNDILINIGKTPLRSTQDLVDAVEASQGKSFEIGLLRDGKPITLTVNPEKRPKNMRRPTLPATSSPEMARLQKLFQQAQAQDGYKPQMRFRFLHPGIVVPPGTSLHPTLPENLSISIVRSGKKPAVIKVERNGEKWEVTEDELDQLPEDIRPHVEQMLNGTVAGAMPEFDFMPLLGPNRNMPVPQNRLEMEKRWQEQIRQMQDHVQQMEQMMEQMRQQMQTPTPPMR